MRQLAFLIGTEAELIKLFPVMNAVQDLGIQYTTILTGQNPVVSSQLRHMVKDWNVDCLLSQSNITKTPLGLLSWFFVTLSRGLTTQSKVLSQKMPGGSVLVVHGDTVSTVMGALLAKRFGWKIAHVEAGLRSFHYFQPFPEELDRVITSRLADWHFCPNEWACNNLGGKSTVVINTRQNTLLDSLRAVVKPTVLKQFPQPPKLPARYSVFALHRQENLLDRSFVRAAIAELMKFSQKMHCLFIVHEPTRRILQEEGLLEPLLRNHNITLSNKIAYPTFMAILKKAEFLVTDGGSNQEESSYFGIPCCIMRTHTERIEGLNENVILVGRDIGAVSDFVRDYKDYRRPPFTDSFSPSDGIAQSLKKILSSKE